MTAGMIRRLFFDISLYTACILTHRGYSCIILKSNIMRYYVRIVQRCMILIEID